MEESSRLREYGRNPYISPKGINRGGFPQNHVAVDGDDMAVHNVGSPEIDGQTASQHRVTKQ